MLEKNKKKLERKNRSTWTPYYQRIVENKKAYNRKKIKKGLDIQD